MLSPFFFIVASLSPSPLKIDRGAETLLKSGLQKVLGAFLLNDSSSKWDEILGGATQLEEECFKKARNGRLNQQEEEKIKGIRSCLEEHKEDAYAMIELLDALEEANGSGIKRPRIEYVRGNPRPDHLRGQPGRVTVHDLEEDEEKIAEKIEEARVDYRRKVKEVSDEWQTFRGPLSQLMQTNPMNAQLSNEEANEKRKFDEDLDALKEHYEVVNGIINELKNEVETWIG